MRKLEMLAMAFVASTTMIACSSSGDTSDGGVARDCTSGETRACTCSGGAAGSQLCSSSGYWQACKCGGACPPGVPSCAGKDCGADDGCGKACETGKCPTGQACVTTAGVPKCGTSCPLGPQCGTKHCGDPDGCGGTCTSAPCVDPKDTCKSGTCVPPAACTPVCVKCGDDDGCKTSTKCTTGVCDKGFTCTSAAACAVDPSSKWVITITKGSIPTDKGWNSFSGPDAMVCLWISGSRVCTQEATNSLSPSWGCTFPPILASTLMAGIDVESFDNDRSGTGSCSETVSTAPGEPICLKGSIPFKIADFKAGTWAAGCTDMSFSATLSTL